MTKITTLLLGGGFTLQRLAKKLPKGTFCITTRSTDTLSEFKARGWVAAQLEVSDTNAVQALFSSYPDLTTVVDSIPPLRSDSSTSGRSGNGSLVGITAVKDAIRSSSVERLFYLSTTGVFGVSDGSEVNEATPPKPQHQRAKARLQAEECYRELSIAVTAFRIVAIYGGGRGIEQALLAGRYPYVDNGKRWSNRIHVDDLVEVLRLAIERPISNPLPPIVCVCDDEPTKTAEVVEYYCKKLGVPFPESISLEDAKRSGLHTLLSNQRVSNKLLKDTLGIVLAHPNYRS